MGNVINAKWTVLAAHNPVLLQKTDYINIRLKQIVCNQ